MGWTTPKTWSAATLSSAEMNTHVRDNLDFLKENIALEAPTELTISGGVITKTKSFHTIDTESDDPSDDLDTIDGGSAGDVIYIMANHTDRTVIVKDGAGNISCGGDVSLDKTGLLLPLIYDAVTSKWLTFDLYHSAHYFAVNMFVFPSPGTDWTPALTGATLAQNKTSKKVWLPLEFLKLGDEIASYKLLGDAVESTTLTLDCKLVRVNKADPITTSDIAGGGISQITVDGNFDAEAVLTAVEEVVTDKFYVLEITGTTASSDTFTVIGAEVKINRL